MKKNGFTLVEVVLSAVIFSIIAVGLASSFFSGMKLWGRAKTTGVYYNDVLLDLEKIYRQLRETVFLPQIGFSGNEREITFAVIKDNSFFKATYKFDPDKKVLLLRQVPLKDIISGGEQNAAVEEVVMQLDDLSFSYFYKEDIKYVWKDKWQIPGFCNAVKIKAKFKDEESEKTIFIPVF